MSWAAVAMSHCPLLGYIERRCPDFRPLLGGVGAAPRGRDPLTRRSNSDCARTVPRGAGRSPHEPLQLPLRRFILARNDTLPLRDTAAGPITTAIGASTSGVSARPLRRPLEARRPSHEAPQRATLQPEGHRRPASQLDVGDVPWRPDGPLVTRPNSDCAPSASPTSSARPRSRLSPRAPNRRPNSAA